MKIEKVHLIRHGQSQANVDQLVCGQMDSPLTSVGVEKVILASNSPIIRELVHLPCYASPLSRALQTAKLLGFQNIIIQDELRETNTGDFSHMKFSEISISNPEFIHHRTKLNARYPNGETTSEMIKRSWASFKNFASEIDSHEIVIVSHGGPLNSIAGHLLQTSFESFPAFLFENNKVTTLTKFEKDSQFWSLLRMNIL